MNEHLNEVIERVQFGAHYQHDEYLAEDHDDPDMLQWINDQLELCVFAKSLTDPTPLSELTEEQWRELGFEQRTGYWIHTDILYADPGNCLEYHPASPRPRDFIRIGQSAFIYHPTLGQLNCLMMGLM